MEMKPASALPLLLAALMLAGGCAGSGRKTAPDLGSLVETERRADDAYGNDRNEEAARLYRSLVEQVPGEAAYWYRLGNVLVRIGRQDDAAIAYQQSLRLDPDNAKAWHNLGIVRLHQAQTSFAAGVQNSTSGDRVFDESLKLSTAVFSLIAPAVTQGAIPKPADDNDAKEHPAGAEPAGTVDTQAGS